MLVWSLLQCSSRAVQKHQTANLPRIENEVKLPSHSRQVIGLSWQGGIHSNQKRSVFRERAKSSRRSPAAGVSRHMPSAKDVRRLRIGDISGVTRESWPPYRVFVSCLTDTLRPDAPVSFCYTSPRLLLPLRSSVQLLSSTVEPPCQAA